MRDLIVVLIVFAALPFAFRRPFVGLMAFSWMAYMRPQDLCWGFARSLRLSFVMGITMVFGWVAMEYGRRQFFRRQYVATLMILLALVISISLTQAYEADRYIMRYYFEFLKIIVIALFTLGQVDTRQRLRAILWCVALSLGFFGFKAGLRGAMTGGVIHQGPGGMMGDNNDFALAMVMNLPLLFYLGRTEGNLLVRRFCDVTFLLSMVTIILTHSRGGFLSMCVVCLLLAWRSGKLVRAIVLLGIGVVVFLNFAPDHVIERLSTIKQGTDEGSANARWTAWTVGLRMIADNPWLGVGLRNFQIGYKIYGEELLVGEKTHVAHNSYLQVWAEAGTFAIIIYMLLLVWVFHTTRKLRHMTRNRPELDWAYSYTRAFEITTAGFMLGSFFLNRGHFDLLYHWIALLACLYWIVRKELADQAADPAPVSEDGPQKAHVRFRSRGDGPWQPGRASPVPAMSSSGLPRWSRN